MRCRKAGEKKLCEFLDGVIERVKKIGAEYVFIKNPDKVEYVIYLICYM